MARITKISELPEFKDIEGLYTLGTDSKNQSVKVSLERVKEVLNEHIMKNAHKAVNEEVGKATEELRKSGVELALWQGLEATKEYFKDRTEGSLTVLLFYGDRTVTLTAEENEYLTGRKSVLGLSSGDMMLVRKNEGDSVNGILIPTQDAKSRKGDFVGADGIETKEDKLMIEQIPQLFCGENFVAGNYNADECLIPGTYYKMVLGRPSDVDDDEHFLLVVTGRRTFDNGWQNAMQIAFSLKYGGSVFARYIEFNPNKEFTQFKKWERLCSLDYVGESIQELLDEFQKNLEEFGEDIENKFEKLVGSAPEALDTLKELADALGNDKDFATTVTNALAGKVSQEDFDNEIESLNGKIRYAVAIDTINDSTTVDDITECCNNYSNNECVLFRVSRDFDMSDELAKFLFDKSSNEDDGFVELHADDIILVYKVVRSNPMQRPHAEYFGFVIPSFVAGEQVAYKSELDDKVDIEDGMGLSSNDYTDDDKDKLKGIEAGAQKNAVTSVNGKIGAVTIDVPTKAQMGLDKVDNTADVDKPISTVMQSALDKKASTTDVETMVKEVENAIPTISVYTYDSNDFNFD